MRPNILWLFSDELRTDALGCYGNARIQPQTPHIDALAAGGVRFTQHFCPSPICVSSRTSILTAQPPERTTVYGNEGYWSGFDFDASAHMTFPEWFGQYDYHTASLGKTHIPRAMQPFAENDPVGASMGAFFDKYRPRDLALLRIGVGGMVGGRWPDDTPYPPRALTKRAMAWLGEHADDDRPWLLRVSWLQPHTPVIPPSSYIARYSDAPFAETADMDRRPSHFEKLFGEMGGLSNEASQIVQRVQREYHALVAWLDDQVGEVLATLTDVGLAESTIVVFQADHGCNLGEGGALAKHIFAPAAHRIPLIIRWPGNLVPVIREDITDGLDLARTLCGLAGIAPADSFEGRDLFNAEPIEYLVSTIGFGAEDSMVLPNLQMGRWDDGGGWPRRTCVRTAQYRFDMNVRRNGRPVTAAEEDCFLADVVADRDERYNRFDDPALAQVVTKLRGIALAQAAVAIEPPSVPKFGEAEERMLGASGLRQS